MRSISSASSALLALLSLSSTTYAQSSSLLRGEERQCDTLNVEADTLDCDASTCDLNGHARIACDGFVLFADRLQIDFDEEQRFTGAVATGNVTAVEGEMVLTCSRATLEGDRIRGRIEGARLEIKERAVPAERLEAGKNRAELRGDLERTGARTFELEDAEFTLCDCDEEPASWLFRSSSVDVDLDDRANLYWSVLWIVPFGQFELPVTPPIPAVSIPFDQRAAGFLEPGIQFYSGAQPQLDLPFFLPLGESWDLTLAPGLRTDWRTDQGNALERLGAPRLGARVRYAPIRGTEGELNIQYQRDAGNEAVRNALRLEDTDPDPCSPDDPNARCGLTNRFAIDWQHRSAIARGMDLLVSGVWYSDDALLADAALDVTDRVNTYTVSRAQLDLRRPTVYAVASVDYILRLSGQCLSGDPTASCGSADRAWDNTRGAELDTLHRGPHFELRMPAFHLGSGFHVEALASATRYGPWLTRVFSDELPLPPSQWVLRGYGGTAWLGGIGPVSLRARTGLDWSLSAPSTLSQKALDRGFEPIDSERRQVTSLFAEAFAELPLARRFGDSTHLLVPKAGIRSIPWQDGDASDAAVFDPYLQRTELTQAVVGLDQEWLSSNGRPLIRLEVEQPFDLETGERLQTVGRLEVRPARGVTLRGWSQVAFGADEPFRELGASARARRGPFDASLAYARWFADSERLRRTVYQIAGVPSTLPVDPTNPGSEQYLRASAGVDLDLFRLSYGVQVLLERPGGDATVNEGRPFAPTQTAVLGYRSPCDCWGFSLNVVRGTSESNGERVADYRTNFQFEIGGYAVGSRNR